MKRPHLGELGVSTLGLAALTALIGTPSARAATIDINFESNVTTEALSGTVKAGVPSIDPIAGQSWNNLNLTGYGASPDKFGNGSNVSATNTYNGASPSYLLDDSGNTYTTMALSVAQAFGNNVAQPTGTTETTADDTLYSGGIGANFVDTPSNIALSLTNIPYAQYTVLAYYSSGASGHNGYITDGSTFYSITNDTSQTSAFPGYVPASIYGTIAPTSASTATTNTPSDYAVFANETNSNLTITLQAQDGSFGLDIMGIQIIQTPEPASLSLFGAFGAAALLRRTRKCLA